MISKTSIAFDNFMNLYDRLNREFPQLKNNLKYRGGSLSVLIPRQEGILNETLLYIDSNDSIFLCIGDFCASWPQSASGNSFNTLVDAIFSYLRGNARIIETYRGEKYWKGDFQINNGNEWETIKSHVVVWAGLFFWRPKLIKINQMNLIHKEEFFS